MTLQKGFYWIETKDGLTIVEFAGDYNQNMSWWLTGKSEPIEQSEIFTIFGTAIKFSGKLK